MIEETLRRIVARNKEAREASSAMSSRVISAILSGSSEELSDVIDELAAGIEGSAGNLLQEQGENQQSGGTDSSAEPTSEPAGTASQSGSGEPVGEEERVGQ